MRVTVLWMAAVLVSLIAYGVDAVREYSLGRYENGGYIADGTENGQAGASTVEALGAVIEASGHFWEEWWDTTGRFGFEHLGYGQDVPKHLGGGFIAVLASSGFDGIDAVRDYLLQFHTEAWVGGQLGRNVFVDYDGVLYMNVGRASSMHPDWDTAVHRLVEQEGDYTVVLSTVLVWAPEDGAHIEMTYRFTLVDGRIDTMMPCPSCRGWWCEVSSYWPWGDY